MGRAYRMLSWSGLGLGLGLLCSALLCMYRSSACQSSCVFSCSVAWFFVSRWWSLLGETLPMTQDVTAAARDDRRAAILSRFYRVFFYFLCRVQSSLYSVYKYWIEEKYIYISFVTRGI